MLELYELQLNIKFSLVFFFFWKPVVYSTNKLTLYKYMGWNIMLFSKLFLIYTTVWFQILLTSYFSHIYKVLGRK